MTAHSQTDPQPALEETPSHTPSPEGDAPAAAELSPETALAARIEQLEAEQAKLKDQLLRSVADGENMRKRFLREQEDTAKYAVTGFARDLVSVVENLQRASGSISEEARAENEALKTLGEGVDMTLRELLGVFERQGIRRIDPVGEKFDHNFHQAVVQVETSDKEPGTVVQVLQAGYVLHDRLLRPAMVGVAKAPSADAQKQLDTNA